MKSQVILNYEILERNKKDKNYLINITCNIVLSRQLKKGHAIEYLLLPYIITFS